MIIDDICIDSSDMQECISDLNEEKLSSDNLSDIHKTNDENTQFFEVPIDIF